MTADPLHPGSTPAEPELPPSTDSAAAPPAQTPVERPGVTRAGVVWAAVIPALLLLVLLIIFIAQNQEPVRLEYFGLVGTVQLGLALLIAAVGGGFLVAAAGAARILQLRVNAHRLRAGRRRP